jgi:hypothetical protein
MPITTPHLVAEGLFWIMGIPLHATLDFALLIRDRLLFRASHYDSSFHVGRQIGQGDDTHSSTQLHPSYMQLNLFFPFLLRFTRVP